MFGLAYGLQNLEQLVAQRRAQRLQEDAISRASQQQKFTNDLALRKQTESETNTKANQDLVRMSREETARSHDMVVAKNIYDNAAPGMPASPGALRTLSQFGYDLPTKIGAADPNNPSLDENRTFTEGGTHWQAGRQAASEKLSQAQAAAEAAAQREQDAIASRESVAAAGRENAAAIAAAGRQNALAIANIAHQPKEQNPVGVGSDVKTTAMGHKYVDLSKYKGKDYSTAQQEAKGLGVYGANTGETDALQNIETARQNIDLIDKNMSPKLSAGGIGRLVTGPLNMAKAATQADPELASVGTYRTAAIQAMRALAGSKGLRINRSEIEAAMQNDIPNITDTLPTAKAKFEKVRKMLESQENGLFGSGGQTAAPAVDPVDALIQKALNGR